MARKLRRQRALQRGEQPPVTPDQLNTVHIKKSKKKALCNNRGYFLTLVTRDKFEKTKPINRCGTCEILSGMRTRGNELHTMSEIQKQLIGEVYEKTDKGAEGKWCLTMLLDKDSNEPASTSLYRSLRRLEKRGIIEKKQNEQKRSIVRLTGRVHILDSGKIVIRQRVE